jgi:hypothetical protein
VQDLRCYWTIKWVHDLSMTNDRRLSLMQEFIQKFVANLWTKFLAHNGIPNLMEVVPSAQMNISLRHRWI